MIHKFTTPSHGYRILIADGVDRLISTDIYESHLVIRNRIVEKNHTPFTNEEIMRVYYGGEINVLGIRMRPIKFKRDRYKKYGKGIYEYLIHLDNQFYELITEWYTPDVVDYHKKDVDYVRGIQFMATSRLHSKKYYTELKTLRKKLEHSIAHKKTDAQKASAFLDLFSKKIR